MVNAYDGIYNHQLIIGDDYRGYLTINSSVGVPLDITGLTGTFKIMTEYSGSVVLTPTVSVFDAANGIVQWHSAKTATENVAAGPYKYALRVVFSGGDTKVILQGTVNVIRMF